MKFIVYGSRLCPDCSTIQEDLETAGAKVLYMDITENLGDMKKFLKFRDSRPEFEPIKFAGNIGIPLIIDEEKNIYFNKEDALEGRNGK